MKLTKQPETEMEYWMTIESIGGFIWRMNHDMGDGRIESTPEIEQNLSDAGKIQERLVSEISQFGVIAPKDCPRTKIGEEQPKAPKGKTWYWDWYHKMKNKFHAAEYEKIICSACPLCEGVERFTSLNCIPCKPWRGMLYQLREPFSCAIISHSGDWNREELLDEIRKEGGDDAVVKFEAKEIMLKQEHESNRE